MKKIIIFCLCINIHLFVMGQISLTSVDTTMNLYLTTSNLTTSENENVSQFNIIPPSPNISDLQKYGNYEVNYSNGKPAISIPLYNIKSGYLSLPISLCYNPSGRKVQDIGSQIGVGWSLNTGGIITRTIIDKVDEYFYSDQPGINSQHWLPYIDKYGKDTSGQESPFYSDTSLLYKNEYIGFSYNWINSFNIGADGNWGGLLDARNINNDLIMSYCENDYDVFRYSLPSGKSGSFIIKGDEIGGVMAMTIPYEPIKIILPNNEIRNATTNYDLQKIIIIDTDGTQYYFGEGTAGQMAVEENYDTDANDPQNYWKRGNTGWLLTSVISSSKSDTIELFYELNSERINYNLEKQIISDVLNTTERLYFDETANDPFYEVEEDCNLIANADATTGVPRFYKNYVPERIETKNGRILFHNNIDNVTNFWCFDCKDWRSAYLDSIQIYNNSGDLIKQIVFNLDQENQYTNHKLLTYFTILDAANEELEKYTFDYYNSANMGRFNIYNSDWWGYFNNAENNQAMPPVQEPITRGRIYCSSDSYSDDQYIMVPRIESSEVRFGICSSGNFTHICDKSSDLDGTRQGMLKEIFYPTGGSTRFNYELNETFDYDSGETIRCAGLRIKEIINFDALGGSNVKTYEYLSGEMREYYRPTLNNLISEQWYHKSYGPGMCYGIDYRLLSYSGDLKYSPLFHNNLIEYSQVSVISGNDGNNIGRTEYLYDLPYFYGWDSNSVYENTYDGIWTSVLLNYQIQEDHSFLNYDIDPVEYGPQKYVNVEDDWKEPLLSYERVYNNMGDVMSETHTKYAIFQKDNAFTNSACRYINLQFSTSESYQSEYEQYWYEDGFSYTSLLNGYSGRNPFEVFSVGFNKFVSACIKPVSITTKEIVEGVDGNSFEVTTEKRLTYEEEFTFLECDSILQSNESIQVVKYKYAFDYNSIENFNILKENNIIGKPIDKRTYVGSKLISGTQTKYNDYGQPIELYNFETMDHDIAFNASNPFTFTKKQNIGYNSDRNVNKTDIIDNLKVYYLWAYNNQYPIVKIESSDSGLDIISIQTIIDSLVLTRGDSKSQIDSDLAKIKNAVSGVTAGNFVSIYTYQPLIGMTSQTDPSGRTTYYEYDDFGRLEYVRNHKGEIINKNDYHYANQ
ncbi:RHS repeat domain-containing protein [uncultured Draconibacterium sp.]|uniref:RHS repeat domain-containing protein n=1 Tax=uncultured Draconibacterium sp. TaxID=1573823 RepID=UPI003216D4E4